MPKTQTINYSLAELQSLSETPLFFLQLIQANKWHRLYYRGMDLEHNEKVRFVRQWYKEKTGWNNLFHCEWNPFGQKVLKHYWPEAESFNDITKTDFTRYANRIQILTGGFPCQPYSTAGKRKGKDDERHLWPEMLRAIREIRPRWVVGENVLGLVNWSGGLVFHEVQADLEAEGYEVQPFLLPAAAVNAPHRRDRIWFVAYANSFRNDRSKKSTTSNNESKQSTNFKQSGSGRTSKIERYGKMGNATDTESQSSRWQLQQRQGQGEFGGCDSIGNVTDTSSRRMERYRREGKREQLQTTEFNKDNSKQFRRMDWEKFPTEPPICGGDDGISTQLDGITFPKWRNESIKGYGNAVVPQVVYQIFKAIQQYELQKM